MKPKDLWVVHDGLPLYNVEDVYILEEDAKKVAKYLETTEKRKFLVDTLSNILLWVRVSSYDQGVEEGENRLSNKDFQEDDRRL